MSSRYLVSSHIWLQALEERVQAQNVLTGRRVLLDPEDMMELEHFCRGLPLDAHSPIHQRFLETDLIRSMGGPPMATPRFELLEKRVARYVSTQLSLNKRKLNEQFSSFACKLSEAQRLVHDGVTKNPKLNSAAQKVVKADLDVVFDHVKSFVSKELDSEVEDSCFEPGFLTTCVGRPLPREDYEQQPCMPETSVRRINVTKELSSPPRRCLILGDDDLLSVCWSQQFETPSDVFELDEALLDFLPKHHGRNIQLHARDLTQGLPPEFCGLYDVIYTDPMYERKGMDLFLRCCSDGLSNSPGARVLFTTRPDMIDDGAQLEQRINDVGLVVEKREKDFSRYRLPEFYRRKLLKGFHQAGISPQLVDGLCQIPYLYADLFWLKKP